LRRTVGRGSCLRLIFPSYSPTIQRTKRPSVRPPSNEQRPAAPSGIFLGAGTGQRFRYSAI